MKKGFIGIFTLIIFTLITLILLLAIFVFIQLGENEKKKISIYISVEKRSDPIKIWVAVAERVGEYIRVPIAGLNITGKVIDPKNREYTLHFTENTHLPVHPINIRNSKEVLENIDVLFRYSTNFSKTETPGTYIVVVNVNDTQETAIFYINRPSKILLEVLDMKISKLSPQEKEELKIISSIFGIDVEFNLSKITGFVNLTLKLGTNDGALPYEVVIESVMITPENYTIDFSKRYYYNTIKNNRGIVYFSHPVFSQGKYNLTLKAKGSYVCEIYYENSDPVSISFDYR